MIVSTDIRLGTTNDLPFIISSWTRSIRYIYPNQFIDNFADTYQPYLHHLISNSMVVVAHEASDINEIISYLVYTSFLGKQVVHFAFTKDGARQQGKLNQLLAFSNPEKQLVLFTHPAKNELMMRHLVKKYVFDPQLLKLIATTKT